MSDASNAAEAAFTKLSDAVTAAMGEMKTLADEVVSIAGSTLDTQALTQTAAKMSMLADTVLAGTAAAQAEVNPPAADPGAGS